MARTTHTRSRDIQEPVALAPLGAASLLEAIEGLTRAMTLLAVRLGSPQPTPPPLGNGDTTWNRLSVPELRRLLREYPIDRTSLPAPIENLRRAELLEALRQIGAMGFGGERA